MPHCINLREHFGDRYRIDFDPAYSPKGVPRAKLEPWYMQIPCRYGVIYPFGPDRLAVEVDGHPRIAAKLDRMPECIPYQRGDYFAAFIFPSSAMPKVSRLVRPYRRRHITEKERSRLRRMGRQMAHKGQFTEK